MIISVFLGKIDYKNCNFNAHRSQYTYFEVDKRENFRLLFPAVSYT